MRVYAIGDVHGHLGLLEAAHARIRDDGGAGEQVVHVGDLLDRGTNDLYAVAEREYLVGFDECAVLEVIVSDDLIDPANPVT